MTKSTDEIEVQAVEHRGKQVLMMQFPYRKELIEVARENLGARYSKTYRGWWLEKEKNTLQRIFSAFRDKAWVDASAIYGGKSPQNKSKAPDKKPRKPKTFSEARAPVPTAYTDKLKLRNYCENTVRTYVSLFSRFAGYFKDKPLQEVTEDEVNAYVLYLVKQKGISTNTQHQVVNAIKFYYERVLGGEKKKYRIERPRKESKLPKVVSADDMRLMLDVTENVKHWCLLAIIYTGGLRRSEVINLRIQDVDINRNQVFVRGGKGHKDRQTLLGEVLSEKLPAYFEKEKPNYWLFEGTGRKKYSGTSIGNVVAAAARRAGIKKRVTPHMLRHSFATHMMDDGTDTRYIQRLMGHNSIRTTSIYTHVSTSDLQNLQSPLDRLLKGK